MIHDEIGEELFLRDLKLKTVIVLVPDHRPEMFTAWVADIGPRSAIFHAGVIRTSLGLRADADGRFFDDLDRRIHVHRYQG